MFKLTLLLLLLIVTACGQGGQIQEPEHIDEEPIIYEPQYEPPPMPIELPPQNEYIVNLEIDPYTRTVQGLSRINFTNRLDTPLETIVMRVFFNAFNEDVISRPYFSGQYPLLSRRGWQHRYGYMEIQYAAVDNQTLSYNLNGTILTLYPDEPIPPHATVQLLLQYTAYVPKIAHRTGGNENAMWFGMFLPVLAAYENGWFVSEVYAAGHPFFLETANYQITITAPIRYTVIGTGIKTEEVIEDTDTRITNFTANMVRDFAFALSPYFHSASAITESGITINLYYLTETLQVGHILGTAIRSMESFESRVGGYPFSQVTIVETDLSLDAMYFSQMIFVDTSHFSQANLWWMVNGLARQWFTTVAGTNQITEPWISDGLSRFIQTCETYRTPEALNAAIELKRESISHRDDVYLLKGLNEHTSRTHAFAQGRQAVIMLYELQNQMGYQNFWTLISRYYYEFSFRIATGQDFINLAEEIYGNSLYEFFSYWLN